MQTSAPTPGPWAWTDRYTLRPAQPDPDSQHIHTILTLESSWWHYTGKSLEEARTEGDANLALIAASPALLDAAEAAAAVLAKGKWLKGSTDPEAVALYKLLDAIALAKAPLAAD